MSPVRIIILAVLFFLLYKLIVRKKPKLKRAVASKNEQQSTQVDDVLVEDPVCHTHIPRKSAESVTVDGETHYFCSQDCLKTYTEEKEPE